MERSIRHQQTRNNNYNVHVCEQTQKLRGKIIKSQELMNE